MTVKQLVTVISLCLILNDEATHQQLGKWRRYKVCSF